MTPADRRRPYRVEARNLKCFATAWLPVVTFGYQDRAISKAKWLRVQAVGDRYSEIRRWNEYRVINRDTGAVLWPTPE